ncbi:MAG: c-type cytochrome [Pacificimonas sp.]
MDSFEWNKIAGWLLAAMIAVLGLIILTGYAFSDDRPEEMAYLPCGEEGCVTEVAGAEEEVDMMMELAMAMQDAEVSKGENVFKKCATCHNIAPGGANKQGPNLYAIMGKDIGSAAGFGYSDALASEPGEWTFEKMNEYIANPRGAIPGNIMAFAGISKASDRAALFKYMNEQGSNLPLPEVTAEMLAGDDPEGTGEDAGKAPDTVEPELADAQEVPNSNIGGPAAPNQDADESPTE